MCKRTSCIFVFVGSSELEKQEFTPSLHWSFQWSRESLWFMVCFVVGLFGFFGFALGVL